MQRQDPLHGYVCIAEANRSPSGLWQQVSRLIGLQETRTNEHARRHRGKGPLHHHPFRPGQGQSADIYTLNGRDGSGRPGAQAFHWQVLAIHQKGWEIRPTSATSRR